MEPLPAVIRMNNVLGFSSVQFDRKYGRYCEGGRQMFLVRIAFTVVLHVYYLWYASETREGRIRQSNVIYGLMLEAESHLWFVRNYIIELNGLIYSKKVVKMLNTSRHISWEVERKFNHIDFQNTTTKKQIWLSAITTVIVNLLLLVCLYDINSNFNSFFNMSVDLLFNVMGTETDLYLLMFSFFVIKIRAELVFFNKYMQQKICLQQVKLMFEIYAEIISQMGLLAQSFAVPIMFNSMLLFYEATMALFRMYCMFTDVYDPESAAAEIASYCIWFIPFAIKMTLTMKMATLTTEKVSIEQNSNFRITIRY